MIFGIREKRIEIGDFTSEKCGECKDCNNYKLIMTTRYLVVFFVNLIPLSSTFEYVCDSCGSVTFADSKAGRTALKEDFRKKEFRLFLINFLKILAFAAVIAAAVILPLTLIKNYGPSTEFFKSLADANGVYNISDKDGNSLATINITDGKKTVTFLDRVSQLVGEPGADGTFYIHEYYKEAEDSKGNTILVRSQDNPGMLCDKYNTRIREYYYDTSSDSMGYALGVENLLDIQYSPDKVVYPYSYYTTGGSKEAHTVIMFINSNQRVSAAFIPSVSDSASDQIESIEIQDYENGRIIKDSLYYFDDSMISLAKSSGLTKNSTSADFLNFIKTNNPDPVTVSEYKYYKDTKVLASHTFSMPDESGKMQTVTQNYEISEKGGYYIQTASENI